MWLADDLQAMARREASRGTYWRLLLPSAGQLKRGALILLLATLASCGDDGSENGWLDEAEMRQMTVGQLAEHLARFESEDLARRIAEHLHRRMPAEVSDLIKTGLTAEGLPAFALISVMVWHPKSIPVVDAITIISRGLRDRISATRVEAVELLGAVDVGSEKLLELSKLAVEDQSYRVRFRAASLLNARGGEYRDWLLGQIGNQSYSAKVRDTMVWALVAPVITRELTINERREFGEDLLRHLRNLAVQGQSEEFGLHLHRHIAQLELAKRSGWN